MIQRKNLFQRLRQIAEQKRNKTETNTTQETLPFDKMYSNGVIQIDKNTFSKTIRFSDVGYQLSKDEDKTRIFSMYCSLLNWFDPQIKFQFAFINQKMEQKAYTDKSMIEDEDPKLKQITKRIF